MSEGRTFHIEDVQDQVELALDAQRAPQGRARLRAVSRGAHPAARRAGSRQTPHSRRASLRLHVTLANGVQGPARHRAPGADHRRGLRRSRRRRRRAVLAETQRNLYDGIGRGELALAVGDGSAHAGGAGAELRLCQRAAVARQAAHRGAVVRAWRADQRVAGRYGEHATANTFPAYIKTGIKAELLDPDLGAST